MFKRCGGFFNIFVSNEAALEAVSEWIYKYLKMSYLIQIEHFSNITIYVIYISCSNGLDKKIIRGITKHLKDKNLYPEEGRK